MNSTMAQGKVEATAATAALAAATTILNKGEKLNVKVPKKRKLKNQIHISEVISSLHRL